MKKATIPVILTAVLIAVAIFPGCTGIGPGDVITEEKDFADFTSIEVADAFEAEITRSDSFIISISADKDTYDYVAVSKEGETLRICLNPRHIFDDFTLRSRTLKAKITLPTLYGLQVSGASKVTVSGFNSSSDFGLNVSGASSLDMADIEAGKAELEISGASKVTGNMKADYTKFEVSGASKVELQGTANSTVLNASGASNVNLTDFPFNTAKVTLNGASEATIDVKERLDIVVSGTSRLYFLGNPVIGSINVSGASTVKHK